MITCPTCPTQPISPHSSRWSDYAGGARAALPWMLGVAPFGLVIGVTAAHAGIPLFAGWLSAPLVFAGSAQLALIQLLDSGAAPAVAVVAALAINLRLVLYSATMAPRWRDRPAWWQALAAYLIVDPTIAVGTDGYDTLPDPERAHRHYLGGGLILWVVWLAAIAGGATAGAHAPSALHLEMVIPLFLTGEVVHRLRDRATVQAAAVAALVAAAAAPALWHLGPIAALAAGIGAGLAAERRRP